MNQAHKLPGVLSLLKEAYQIYRKNFSTYLSIVLVSVLATILSSVVILVSIVLYSLNFFSFTSVASIFVGTLILLAILGLLVLSLLLQLWVFVALLVQAKQGGSLSFFEAFKQSREYVLAYLGTSILIGLAIFGAISVLVVPFLFIVRLIGFIIPDNIATGGNEFLTSLVILVLLALFSLPSILLAVWLNFVSYIIVLENRKSDLLMILARSKELVKGYWWAIAWRMLFLVIISLVIAFGVIMVAELVGIEGLEFVNNIISVLLAPLFIFYTLGLYQSLVKIKGNISVDKKGSSYTIIKYLVWLGVVMIIVIPVTVAVSILG